MRFPPAHRPPSTHAYTCTQQKRADEILAEVGITLALSRLRGEEGECVWGCARMGAWWPRGVLCWRRNWRGGWEGRRRAYMPPCASCSPASARTTPAPLATPHTRRRAPPPQRHLGLCRDVWRGRVPRALCHRAAQVSARVCRCLHARGRQSAACSTPPPSSPPPRPLLPPAPSPHPCDDREWHRWDKAHGSENDPVDIFGREQLFVVFVVADGGSDLEHFEFRSFEELRSVLTQVGAELARRGGRGWGGRHGGGGEPLAGRPPARTPPRPAHPLAPPPPAHAMPPVRSDSGCG